MDRIADALSAVSRYLVLVLVLVGFVNVVLRYFGELLGRRLTSNEVIEAQWYGFGLIFLLALPFVLKNQINVRVDFWFAKQSPQRRAWVDLVGHFVGLLPFTLLGIWIAVNAARSSWRISETSPEGGLPYYPIKTVIAVVMTLALSPGDRRSDQAHRRPPRPRRNSSKSPKPRNFELSRAPKRIYQ